MTDRDLVNGNERIESKGSLGEAILSPEQNRLLEEIWNRASRLLAYYGEVTTVVGEYDRAIYHLPELITPDKKSHGTVIRTLSANFTPGENEDSEQVIVMSSAPSRTLSPFTGIGMASSPILFAIHRTSEGLSIMGSQKVTHPEKKIDDLLDMFGGITKSMEDQYWQMAIGMADSFEDELPAEHKLLDGGYTFRFGFEYDVSRQEKTKDGSSRRIIKRIVDPRHIDIESGNLSGALIEYSLLKLNPTDPKYSDCDKRLSVVVVIKQESGSTYWPVPNEYTDMLYKALVAERIFTEKRDEISKLGGVALTQTTDLDTKPLSS